MSTGDRGAWAELLVLADLLKLGYQPFRAVSPAAPCDVVADVAGTLVRIEVRCVTTVNERFTPMTNWHTEAKASVGAYVWPDGTVSYSPIIPGAMYEAHRVNRSGIRMRKTS